MAVGRAAAWLTLFMVIVTFVVVVMRYVFDAGLIWVQESVVWMHAAVFMLGRGLHAAGRRACARGYFLSNDERAASRVGRPDRGRYLPAAAVPVSCLELLRFRHAVLEHRESSRESGGLPYPFVPMLKSIVLLMPLTVALQGLSTVL